MYITALIILCGVHEYGNLKPYLKPSLEALKIWQP
jgi:hypothetical protein